MKTNLSKLAKVLNITRPTLYKKIQDLVQNSLLDIEKLLRRIKNQLNLK